jgi:hypothetical protein
MKNNKIKKLIKDVVSEISLSESISWDQLKKEVNSITINENKGGNKAKKVLNERISILSNMRPTTYASKRTFDHICNSLLEHSSSKGTTWAKMLKGLKTQTERKHKKYLGTPRPIREDINQDFNKLWERL